MSPLENFVAEDMFPTDAKRMPAFTDGELTLEVVN